MSSFDYLREVIYGERYLYKYMIQELKEITESDPKGPNKNLIKFIKILLNSKLKIEDYYNENDDEIIKTILLLQKKKKIIKNSVDDLYPFLVSKNNKSYF